MVAVSPPIKRESRAYFKTLGAHIGLLRKARGMTQAELARAIGVSQQAVFAYELGDRRVSVLILIKVAKVFTMSLDVLTGMSAPTGATNDKVSPRALRHGKRIQALPITQQRFVLRILSILEEHNA